MASDNEVLVCSSCSPSSPSVPSDFDPVCGRVCLPPNRTVVGAALVSQCSMLVKHDESGSQLSLSLVLVAIVSPHHRKLIESELIQS